jgi:hypothetical protein
MIDTTAILISGILMIFVSLRAFRAEPRVSNKVGQRRSPNGDGKEGSVPAPDRR